MTYGEGGGNYTHAETSIHTEHINQTKGELHAALSRVCACDT